MGDKILCFCASSSNRRVLWCARFSWSEAFRVYCGMARKLDVGVAITLILHQYSRSSRLQGQLIY